MSNSKKFSHSSSIVQAIPVLAANNAIKRQRKKKKIPWPFFIIVVYLTFVSCSIIFKFK